ncbi:MAG TPA: cytochrome c [Steroidobacteraceae bacterium]|nr:cytochrome c [Steroidobacteraceae bacterium]
MTRSARRVALIAMAVVGACASCFDPEALASGDPAVAGKSLYSQSCARCHGFQMVNPGPGVFDLRNFPREDRARFVLSVSEGKGAMPSWKGTLSSADIELLWAYVTADAR